MKSSGAWVPAVLVNSVDLDFEKILKFETQCVYADTHWSFCAPIQIRYELVPYYKYLHQYKI